MIKVDIQGSDDVKRLLQEVAPRNALNISRATVHGVAGEVSKLVKANAPKEEGDLKKSIKTKRHRMKYGFIRSDVIAERGKTAKADGFYWRFLENGTSKLAPQRFVLPSVREIATQLPDILHAQFVKKFVAAIARAKKRG